MGLELKISAEELSNSFVLFDCTLNYSANNTGGYGYPNPEISKVTDAYFEIYPPNQTSPYKIDVYPDFPRTDQVGYEIFPYMIGMTENAIESGVYLVRYVVKGINQKGVAYTSKTEKRFLFTKTAECCVDTKFRKVTKDAFKVKEEKNSVELMVLMEAAKRAEKCGLYGQAQKILDHINAQCECCCS